MLELFLFIVFCMPFRKLVTFYMFLFDEEIHRDTYQILYFSISFWYQKREGKRCNSKHSDPVAL